jgi:hypothetical protein
MYLFAHMLKPSNAKVKITIESKKHKLRNKYVVSSAHNTFSRDEKQPLKTTQKLTEITASPAWRCKANNNSPTTAAPTTHSDSE